jgi:hypothetical protein
MDQKQALIGRLKRLARTLGRDSVTRTEFTRRTGIPIGKVQYHFGKWSEFCRAAGLTPNRPRGVPIPDDELFAAMRDALLALGRVGTKQDFAKHFRFGPVILLRRGWTWRTALALLGQWATKNDPTFPYLDQLPKPEEAPAPGPRLVAGRNGLAFAKGHVPSFANGRAPRPAKKPAARRRGGRAPRGPGNAGRRVYGDLLGFRCFLNAPTNEIAVAMLFAVVAADLGFAIEWAGSAFPDCDARRRVGPGKWRRVRIEFEYLSRNFAIHDHDPAGCDLIVCWEDNWGRDAPVEVLELKTLIERLRARG